MWTKKQVGTEYKLMTAKEMTDSAGLDAWVRAHRKARLHAFDWISNPFSSRGQQRRNQKIYSGKAEAHGDHKHRRTTLTIAD